MGCFCSADMRQLLHNKFVVVLGDSIQRSVYKDLVKLLQVDDLLTEDELRDRGEITFLNDTLVEGGERDGMHNGTNYREVRQYRTGHHLVRLYFLTRVYSTYMESILSDLKGGLKPDVVIVSSCIWDVNRYNDNRLEAYKSNLDVLFQRLKEVLNPQCLIIWTMTMPVGFRPHEISEYMTHMTPNLRPDIVEGNFFSAVLANHHKLDVLDMHYHFRFNLRSRCSDSVHWDKLAHRKYTQILLTHIARAWGVKMPKSKIQNGKMLNGSFLHDVPPHLYAFRGDPFPNPPPLIQERWSQGKIPLLPIPNGVVMGSQFSEQRMMSPGATLWHPSIVPSFDSPGPADMPGHRSFDVSDNNPMPGSFLHEMPPHLYAFRGDSYPNLSPLIQDRRCSQGKIPLLPTPNDEVMGSQSTGQRMLSPGAVDMPGYIPFNGSDINTVPGPPVCAVPPHSVAFREDPNLHSPIPERELRSPGPGFNTPPFAGQGFTTSPFAGPGFSTPPFAGPGFSTPPFADPGFSTPPFADPGFSTPPFADQGFTTSPFSGRNFPIPLMLSPMNFSPFPLHDQYPQGNWDPKMRRAVRPREGWTPPYPRPPKYLPGID